MSVFTYQYLYMLNEPKDIKRVLSTTLIDPEYKYLPYIDDENLDEFKLIGSLILIVSRKPYLGFYGFTKVTGIIKKNIDEESTILYNKLISANKICELENLYFLKYKKIFVFKKLFNKDIYLKDYNYYSIDKNDKPLKFPKELTNFNIKKYTCAKIIETIYDTNIGVLNKKYVGKKFNDLFDNDQNYEDSSSENSSSKSNDSFKSNISVKSNSSVKSTSSDKSNSSVKKDTLIKTNLKNNKQIEDDEDNKFLSKNIITSNNISETTKIVVNRKDNNYKEVENLNNQDIFKTFSVKKVSNKNNFYDSDSVDEIIVSSKKNKSDENINIKKLDDSDKKNITGKNNFALKRFNKKKVEKDKTTGSDDSENSDNSNNSDYSDNSDNSDNSGNSDNSENPKKYITNKVKKYESDNISANNSLNKNSKNIVNNSPDKYFNNYDSRMENLYKNNTELFDNTSDKEVKGKSNLSNFEKLCLVNRLNNIKFVKDKEKCENNDNDENHEDGEEEDDEELKLLGIEQIDEEIEVDEIEFVADELNEKDIVKLIIPILWVPCKELELVLKDNQKISKNAFSKHYVNCSCCEFNNNNKKDIINKNENIKIFTKTHEDKDEINEIIKYYKLCKNYVMSKKIIKKENYLITDTLLFYYNNSEEKIYNNCIFILKFI